jgi:replicative DNA helicase
VSLVPDFEVPADIECEKTLLGAVLLDNAAWDEVALIPKEAWSLDSHLRIRMAMKRLAAAGTAIDIRTLANHLTGRHEIEAVGGVAYLASLTEGLPRRPAIGDYIKIVNDKSVLRQLMLLCQEGIQRAQDQSEAGLEVLGSIQARLETMGSPAGAKSAAVESFFMEALEKANQRYQSKQAPRIPTGNAFIDSKIGGILHGYYTICAARPKVGKSAFGDTAIAYNCQRARRVVKISLEVDREMSLYNLVPHVVNLPNIVCVRQELQTPEQNQLFNEGMGKVLEWPLRIYEGDIDCDEACWIIEKETRAGDEVLFVLDHFGLMVEAGKNNPSKIRESYVLDSGRLRRKIYGKKAALLALFQLNEVPREYADKLPRPADIGESKKPLQDCAAMILLHRYQDKETLKMTRKANVNLSLVRGGGSPGNLDGEFDTKKLEFIVQSELEYDIDDYRDERGQ